MVVGINEPIQMVQAGHMHPMHPVCGQHCHEATLNFAAVANSLKCFSTPSPDTHLASKASSMTAKNSASRVYLSGEGGRGGEAA